MNVVIMLPGDQHWITECLFFPLWVLGVKEAAFTHAFRCYSLILSLLVFCLVLICPLPLPATVAVFEHSQAAGTIQVTYVSSLLLWGSVRKQASLNLASHSISSHHTTHVHMHAHMYFLTLLHTFCLWLIKSILVKEPISSWPSIIPTSPV